MTVSTAFGVSVIKNILVCCKDQVIKYFVHYWLNMNKSAINLSSIENNLSMMVMMMICMSNSFRARENERAGHSVLI